MMRQAQSDLAWSQRARPIGPIWVPTMIAKQKELIGLGLYTPGEAARFARIPSIGMTSRWAHGTRRHDPVIHPQLVEDPERLITFLDFTQLQAIRSIRNYDESISLQKIRAAIDHVESKYDLDYPLAREHKIILHGDDLWINVKGMLSEDDPDLFTQVTGRRGRDQQMIREIAQLYQRDMHYLESGLPGKFDLYRSREGDRTITMDPKVRFGQPVLDSGYSLDAILDAYRSEGGMEQASQALGISEGDIELAISCDDSLGLPTR